MPSLRDCIIQALRDLGGAAHLQEIRSRILENNPNLSPGELKSPSIRWAIQHDSLDSNQTNRSGNDIFFSVEGLRKGYWGLRDFHQQGIQAVDDAEDVDLPPGTIVPQVVKQTVSRRLRDTVLSRAVKERHGHRCQFLSCKFYESLPATKRYAEAHHIRPLGSGHNGPDFPENILCLCPNHHALLDFGFIKIQMSELKLLDYHKVSQEFVDYHNLEIYRY